MKWNRILPYLSQGGAIRRESWEEERWVELGEEALYSFPIFLLDQNGEEVELLENASQLDEAIAKLEAAMKQKVDFNKEYNEYEPVEEQPEPTPTPEPEPKNNTAIIVVSILVGI